MIKSDSDLVQELKGSKPEPKAAEPADPTALFRQLSAASGGDFSAALALLNVIEAAAHSMAPEQRLQVARLLTASGHALELTTRKDRVT